MAVLRWSYISNVFPAISVPPATTAAIEPVSVTEMKKRNMMMILLQIHAAAGTIRIVIPPSTPILFTVLDQ